MTTLSKAGAERLVQQIAEAEDPIPLIAEAFRGEAHLALGYQTWKQFVAGELPTVRCTNQDARVRASVHLTNAGMSPRSIALVLGVVPEAVLDDVWPRRRRKKSRESAKAKGAQIRRRVEEYEGVMARHPGWSPGAVKDYLGIDHPKEVTRRRLFSEAPGEVQGYLYSGQITEAVAEVVLAHQYVKDEDKWVVLRKVVTGVITSTGTPKMREMMALIPEVQRYPDLLLRWRSPDLRMTVDQLREELIDIRHSRTVSRREQAVQAAGISMMMKSGFNALDWLAEVSEKVDLVEQMWPVLTANPWVRTRLERQLAEIGERMLRLAQQDGPVGPEDEPREMLVIQGTIVD